MNDFWHTLPKPFFVLAPMADVTDAAFRRIIAKYGKPDVMYTEFVSADGLFRGGYDALIKDLIYTEAERPIVAQFFSPEPKLMERAAALAVELGFDGVDINMGCPDKNVCKQGSGAAMINTPDRARAIIHATQKGAASRIPVTVKTRIGYNTIALDTWLPELLAEQPSVVTLHARTRKEMSKVPAHWDVITQAVALRNKLQKHIPEAERTLIVGNGDVVTLAEARERVRETGCDGVMIARGIYGNPWLFSEQERPSLTERLRVLVEHVEAFDTVLGDGSDRKVKNFHIMKKHFKSYLKGSGQTKELFTSLMNTQTAPEALQVLQKHLTSKS